MRNSKPLDRLKSLSLEEKILMGAALMTIVACQFPWYGINSTVINESWNVFESIGAVAGAFLVATSLLVSAAYAALILFSWNIFDRLPWNKAHIMGALFGQNAFVCLLFLPVYSQYALMTSSNGGVRMGIYLAFIASLTGAITAVILAHRKEAPRNYGFVQDARPIKSIEDYEESWKQAQNYDEAELVDEQETLVGLQDTDYSS